MHDCLHHQYLKEELCLTSSSFFFTIISSFSDRCCCHRIQEEVVMILCQEVCKMRWFANHDRYTGFLHRKKSFITHFTLDFHLRLLLSFKSYLILFFLMTEMIDMSGKVKEISVTTGLTLILALFLLRA